MALKGTEPARNLQ